MVPVQNVLLCDQANLNYFRKLEAAFSENKQFSFLFISSEEEYDDWLNEQARHQVDQIFIQVDLQWRGLSTSKVQGFQVAKGLRAHRFRCPFFFVSMLPEDAFPLDDFRFTLLRVPDFHRVIKPTQLPQIITQGAQQPFSSEQLEDILDSLMEKRSLIREVLHDLKNKLIVDKKNPISKELLLGRVNSQLDSLRVILSDHLKELASLQEELITRIELELQNKSGDNLTGIVDEMTDRFLQLTPEKEKTEGNDEIKEWTPWQVIVVEDEEQVREQLVAHFKRNRIKCLAFQHGEKALKTIAEDAKRNYYTVLICDLRLRQPNSEKWQRFQGYDILWEAYRRDPNYLSFFALTSGRKRLFRLKSEYVRINAYYKKDVMESEGAMNVFMQKVRDAGDDTYFKLKCQPRSGPWMKSNHKYNFPLRSYYRYHLFAPDYLIQENDINRVAADYINNTLQNNIGQNERIPFTGTIKESTPYHPDAIHKFRTRTLTGRRIALGLFYNYCQEEEICQIMQNKGKVTPSDRKLLFNTSLGLSFQKDLPSEVDIAKGNYFNSHLLEEEIVFLKKEMKVDFDLNKIEELVKDLVGLTVFIGDFQSSLEKYWDRNGLEKIEILDESTGDISSVKRAMNLLQLIKKEAKKAGMTADLYKDLKSDYEEMKSPSLKAELGVFLNKIAP